MESREESVLRLHVIRSERAIIRRRDTELEQETRRIVDAILGSLEADRRIDEEVSRLFNEQPTEESMTAWINRIAIPENAAGKKKKKKRTLPRKIKIYHSKSEAKMAPESPWFDEMIYQLQQGPLSYSPTDEAMWPTETWDENENEETVQSPKEKEKDQSWLLSDGNVPGLDEPNSPEETEELDSYEESNDGDNDLGPDEWDIAEDDERRIEEDEARLEEFRMDIVRRRRNLRQTGKKSYQEVSSSGSEDL